jgi:hypothetical protein
MRQFLSEMAGLRVQSQQAETPGNFVQYISGKAAAALR